MIAAVCTALALLGPASGAAPGSAQAGAAPASETTAPGAVGDASDEAEASGSRIEAAGWAELGYHERQPLPTPDGVGADPSRGVSAAAGLSIGGTLPSRPALELYGAIGYRSGLGMRTAFEDAGGTARRPRARSQDLNLDVGVRSWPAGRAGQLGVGATLGYVLRPFHVEAKLGFPGYALHGPAIALSIDARLANGVVRLMIAPKAGFGFVTRSRDVAAAPLRGPLLGGVVGLGVRVYRRLFFTLNYREQHGLLSGDAGKFHDGARWVTAGFAFIHHSPKKASP